MLALYFGTRETGPEESHVKEASGEGMLMQPGDPFHMEVKTRTSSKHKC